VAEGEETYLECNCGNLIARRGEIYCSACREKRYGKQDTEHRAEVDADFDKLMTREPEDNWKHRSKGMRCATCMYYVPKSVITREIENPRSHNSGVGRCRRRAPTMNGWPVMHEGDWCGDHKLDEEKIDAD
jgi:hypothetical protein